MINIVILEGRIGGDAECANKNAPVKFSLVTWENYRDENEESGWKTINTWHNITVWGKPEYRKGLADRLKKGTMVTLQGAIKNSNWETEEGEKRRSNDIVANFVKVVPMPSDSKRSQTSAPSSSHTSAPTSKEVEVEDDDLPF